MAFSLEMVAWITEAAKLLKIDLKIALLRHSKNEKLT